MTLEEEYGPDNPRAWDPDDESLDGYGELPHETGGMLRMFRAGWAGKDLLDIFKIKVSELKDALDNDLEAESLAQEAGAPIHDAPIKPAT